MKNLITDPIKKIINKHVKFEKQDNNSFKTSGPGTADNKHFKEVDRVVYE
jgi:hypothetical protein